MIYASSPGALKFYRSYLQSSLSKIVLLTIDKSEHAHLKDLMKIMHKLKEMFPDYKFILSDALEANSSFKVLKGSSQNLYQFRVIYYDTMMKVRNVYFKHGQAFSTVPTV